MGYNVAVVGATGNVGREVLNILAERNFPVNNLYALASEKSKGKQVSFGDDILTVEVLSNFKFDNVDIALFSPGSKVSAEFAPTAAKSAVVIDNTPFFRMENDVPLVVPEVNLHTLKDFYKRNIIANPNCAVMQLVVALKPLHDFAKIKRVVVTTLQSVSGAGKAAMDELYNQTKAKYMNNNTPAAIFTKQIAFNIIPHIGSFLDSNNTSEEDKVINELKKILDQDIEVAATCVRIPVFVGHSESVNIEFEKKISADEARKILKNAPGVMLVDNPKFNHYTTPIDCVGDDSVYVSRIREDASIKNGLNIWVVSDNLRKGAALNAVQIAEELVKNYL